MKLVLYRVGELVQPGLLVTGGVIGIGDLCPSGSSPQSIMVGVIDEFETLRPALESRLADGIVTSIDSVELLAPLPRPGKVLGCIGNYWEHAQREPRPLNMFLKNPDAVIGPGGTIELPDFEDPWIFMHEAELALVLKGPSKRVPRDRWRDAVFGYTCLIDVSAREQGRHTWRSGSWLGKSFDTFCPIGPCIATADEVEDPNDLRVQFLDDGQLRHDYSTDDMEHRVPELVEFATTIMTMNTGDLISCGTNHEGLGPLQDGETVEITIERVGTMSLSVRDPLKRAWERGVYMGADSTNHDAVRRQRRGDAENLQAPRET